MKPNLQNCYAQNLDIFWEKQANCLEKIARFKDHCKRNETHQLFLSIYMNWSIHSQILFTAELCHFVVDYVNPSELLHLADRIVRLTRSAERSSRQRVFRYPDVLCLKDPSILRNWIAALHTWSQCKISDEIHLFPEMQGDKMFTSFLVHSRDATSQND